MTTLVGMGSGWRAKKRRRTIMRKVLAYVLTSVLAMLFAAPFIWMVSMSLQSPAQLSQYPPQWIPDPPVWHNYPKAMSYPMRPFATFFKNSAIYTSLATLGVTISSSLCAFAFSRLRSKYRDALFFLVLSTMMLPSQVTLIPTYIIFMKLGWIDSLKSLIVPAWLGNAFYIFLMRQYFLTIPRELDEAAIIDGCNYAGIYWRVIMPLAKPIIITVIAFSIIATWNDFMGPLIYLNSTDRMTVAVGLSLFKQMSGGTGTTDIGMVMAAAVTCLLPMIVTFLSAQRYFVASITMTGLKG